VHHPPPAGSTSTEGDELDTDIVYVPAHPDVRPGHDGVRFETRMTEAGQPVGVAFRRLDSLVRALGHAQPWIAVPLPRLRQIFGAAGIGQIVLDPQVPLEPPRWRADEVTALSRWMEKRANG
jgi:hypothetical protein